MNTSRKAMFKRFEKVLSGHFHKKSDDAKYIILVLNMK